MQHEKELYQTYFHSDLKTTVKVIGKSSNIGCYIVRVLNTGDVYYSVKSEVLLNRSQLAKIETV